MRERLRYVGLSLIALVVFSLPYGCVKKAIVAENAGIRYQTLEIPRYVRSDYEQLITSPDTEIQYNAICQLIPYAAEYAGILEKELSQEDAQEKKPTDKSAVNNAKKVYNAISKALYSKEKSIQTAALIFITQFSSEYSNKAELFNRVKKVKANEARTQYEQIRAMLALVDDQAEFDPDFINRFLDSRSWLIRSMAYLLLGEIPSQDYHDRLIKEFQKTHQEYDKLLIIYAFKQGFGQNVFDLLKNELISTESERIKAQIIETTKASKDKTALIQWLLKEQSTIENKILSDVLDVYSAAIASPAGSAFFNRLFQSKNKTLINLINEEILFQALFDALEDEGINNDLAVVERAASADAVIGKDWRAYADRRKVDRRKKLEQEKREEALINEVLPEYNALLEKFLEDTKKLFGDAGMRPDEVEDSTATIKELLELTTKEASK